MKYTQNYNLRKPEDTDPADIQDLNYNADKIDTKLKELEDEQTTHEQASNPHSITPALIGAETPTGAQQKANQAETNAKNYADQVASDLSNQAETNAKSYADIVANSALNSAKDYADIVTNSALNSAKDYADDVLESANSHTDQVASDLSQKVDETRIKVLGVEQDVSNISKVLTNLNPNQEAKQTATGYGIVSLPKNAANGQVSASVKGQTATNIINNGNFTNGTSGWQGINATISVSNNIMQVVPDGSAIVGWLVQNTSYSIFPSRKYFIKAKLRVTNNDCVRMRAYIRSTGGSGDSTYTITAPVANQWYSLAIILDSQATHAGNFRLLFDHEYADAATANGKIMEVQEVMVIDLIAHGLENKTHEELNQMFPHWFDGTKSTVSAMRLKSVSADETETSTAYVVAKDEEGNIAELRSLPNGVKDEVNDEGKLVQRIKPYTLVASDIFSVKTSYPNYDYAVIRLGDAKSFTPEIDNQADIPNKVEITSSELTSGHTKNNGYYSNAIEIWFAIAKGTTLTQAQTQLAGLTLTYQLATPIEIPIQTSGSLVSYPSGTVYIEPFVADAGIYVDKMEVLYSDLPIKALEKISKVDFITGLETELDVSEPVIAGDKLSFTHPDLEAGDIVFFVYEYDRESTVGETEIEYYDSRYVIKGEDDKFYQWEIEAKLVEGVITPSIKLVEV